MGAFQETLRILLLGAEGIAALIAILYFFRLKNSYWKWFSIYLVLIFVQEYWFRNHSSFLGITKQFYYTFFGIPIQYLFLYWLYGLKSLKNTKLFLYCSAVYVLILILVACFSTVLMTQATGINIGTIILMIVVVLEFMKQIKNDNILKFRENKMFYINLGVILFYVGSFPYNIFRMELYSNYYSVWKIYYSYFLIANCIMYLLFAASFIWGKKNS